MAKVLGFSAYKYNKHQLEKVDDFTKLRWYLDDKYFDTKCYNSIEEFFENLNNGCVYTNFWWFIVEF